MGKLDCKPVDTLIDLNVKLVPGHREPLGDSSRYQRLVGKLSYLTITRPNISFSMSFISKFLQSSYESHWDVIIYIIQYIKGIPCQVVLYEHKGHT